MNDLDNIGVVIRIDEDEAIVMTDDVVFKRIKKRPGIYKGQKILISDSDIIQDSKANKKYFYPVFAAIASLLLIILASFHFFFDTSKPYLYMSIDINPSIELEVDDNECIDDIRALNIDGKILMENIKVKGIDINNAIRLIIEKSREMGYVKGNDERGTILIAAELENDNVKEETEGEKKFDEFLNRIKKDINKTYSSLLNAEVVKVPQGLREKAERIDLSMGRYYIYSEAGKNGRKISIEELYTTELGVLLGRIRSDNTDTNVNNEKAELVTKQPSASESIKPTPKERSSSLPVTHAVSTLPTPMIIPTLPQSTPLKLQTSKLVPTPKPVPTPQQIETIMSKGLIGEYYNCSDFTQYVISRIDPEVNFRWAENAPDAMIGEDTFSVRWTGFVVPRFSERYTFSTYADDGVRLWVNNTLIIDNWKSQSPVLTEGSIDLEAGKCYEIKLEYFEDVKSCQVKLSWRSDSQKQEIIPSSQLFHKADVYEGEKAAFSRSMEESTNTGFSGSGYINFNNEVGGYIDWVINIKNDGLYTLNFWYANGADIDRPLEIRINDSLVCSRLSFDSTGSWTKWGRQYIGVNLKAGINVIRTSAVLKDGPNIDRMEVLFK
ncbi:MAG TPA: PA14 domain-containing protein [Pseudobacteroides sp.]|uniref:anti-sigma-I factor RsgI family protein n=1 Tax=Pseudobacteroides sp. TaxID=1968840 RepID=UPI002F956D6B